MKSILALMIIVALTPIAKADYFSDNMDDIIGTGWYECHHSWPGLWQSTGNVDSNRTYEGTGSMMLALDTYGMDNYDFHPKITGISLDTTPVDKWAFRFWLYNQKPGSQYVENITLTSPGQPEHFIGVPAGESEGFWREYVCKMADVQLYPSGAPTIDFTNIDSIKFKVWANYGNPATVSDLYIDDLRLIDISAEQYTITATSGANGTIDPNEAITVNYGGSQLFTATPNTGYTVDAWYLDGGSDQAGGNTYTLEYITADHTVHVTFKQQYTVTATSDANGSIDPSGDITVNEGDDLTFTAIPNTDYEVDTWYLDGGSDQAGGNTYTLEYITANHTVHVTFSEPNPCQPQLDAGINLSADFNGDCIVDINDLAHFALRWLSSPCSQSNDWCDGADMAPPGSPDGSVNLKDFAVLGDGWMAQIEDTVTLDYADSDSFIVTSGDYTFEYTKSDELMFITKTGQSPLCLATGFARGGMYDFLNASYVSNVSAVDYTDRIEVNITGSKLWADYVITLYFYKHSPGMMRYRCEVDTLQSKINDDAPNPDWRFYNKNTQQFISGNVSDYTGPYAGGYQWGRRYDALCYFYESDVIQSQVFFKADLTSMDDYYLETGSDPTAVTTANNSEFGVKIPHGQTATPAQHDYTLYDCYLYLTPDQPANDADAMVRFVNNFGDSYRYMQKPATSEYTDWPTLAIQMATDVTASENWGDPWWINGTSKKFPLPYVDLPHKGNKEIIPNAGMLLPLTQYEQKWGPLPGSIPLIDGKTLMTRLRENMVNFYKPNWLGTGQGVTWNNPGGPWTGDVDAWYYVYPNMQMASFALTGDSTAYNSTLGSIGRFVDVGIAINYEYKKQLSVYYKTASGYHENDSNGSFIYHMMQLYQLTGNTYYLSQAMLAAPHVADKGLDLAYEIHMTAASFAGLMWLYDVTGDATYLEYAYTPLANLLFHSWVWENDYGYAIDYRTFWLISATPGNPISAQFEEAEIWRYVYEGYLKGGEDLSPQAQALISEMIKWKMMASKYSLPPFLPSAMIDTTPGIGVNNLSYHIPLEDIRHGRDLAGQIGQEVYGMNMFWYSVMPYRVFQNGDIFVYSDYPILDCTWDSGSEQIQCHIGGSSDYQTQIRIEYKGSVTWTPANIKIYKTDSNYQNPVLVSPVTSTSGLLIFDADGSGYYSIGIN